MNWFTKLQVELSNEWKVHNVFHASLLKLFCADKFYQVSPTDEASTTLEEINEPVYNVKNILRWRHKKVKNKCIREFLVLWASYPLEEATWEPENSFLDREALHKDFKSGIIPEDK